MSKVNQILIWVTLFIVGISLTTAYFWPEAEVINQEQAMEQPVADPEQIIVKMQDLVVTVLNGSQKDGMAQLTKEFLELENIYVTRIGNAPNRDYQVSEIIYHPESAQAAYELAKLLDIRKRTPASSFESKLFITIVIGADYGLELSEENQQSESN